MTCTDVAGNELKRHSVGHGGFTRRQVEEGEASVYCSQRHQQVRQQVSISILLSLLLVFIVFICSFKTDTVQ